MSCKIVPVLLHSKSGQMPKFSPFILNICLFPACLVPKMPNDLWRITSMAWFPTRIYLISGIELSLVHPDTRGSLIKSLSIPAPGHAHACTSRNTLQLYQLQDYNRVTLNNWTWQQKVKWVVCVCMCVLEPLGSQGPCRALAVLIRQLQPSRVHHREKWRIG